MKPKLTSDDVAHLKQMRALARTKEAQDARFEREAAAATLKQLKAFEASVSHRALYWWTNVVSSRLNQELDCWKEKYRWEKTNHGWRAFRFVKSRRLYATHATYAGLRERPEPTFIRIPTLKTYK
jgi:hypothetical protein